MKLRYFIISILAVLVSFPATSQPKVVVTFPALYSLAAMAMEGVGKPELLLTAQQDAHHMQLRPSQMKAVLESDLFLYYDRNFEVFVPKLRAAGTRKTKFLALSAVLADEHRSPADHGWLNPDFAIAMLQFLAVELGRIDPAHATRYTQNAEGYASAIEEKASGWRESLYGKNNEEWILSDHDAFSAFAGYFQLKNILALEDAQGEASLRNLKKLSDKKFSCVMITHGHSALMDRIAQQSGAKVNHALNPLGSLYEPSETLYFDLMDHMVQEFKECLTHP